MSGRKPLQCAVSITAQFELPIPPSWSAGKTADAINGDIQPTARPDIDNYLKAIFDAINGIVVADDSQIVAVSAQNLQQHAENHRHSFPDTGANTRRRARTGPFIRRLKTVSKNYVENQRAGDR